MLTCQPPSLVRCNTRKEEVDDRFVFFSLSRCSVCQHNGEKHSETAERYKMDIASESGECEKISVRSELELLT